MDTGIICCAIVAVAFSPICASSTITTTPNPASRYNFPGMDIDHDGRISLAELYALYGNIDKNGDGHVRLPEYMASTGLTKQQALPAFNYYDIDKDGDVIKAEVKQIFNLFDADDDGGITPQELAQAFSVIEKTLMGGVGK